MEVVMARARTKARIRRAGVQPVQVLAGLVALALLVLGIIGFNETGVTDWGSSNVATVIGFHLTAGRSLVYVLAGAVGILLALLAGTARLYGWLLMIAFAALTLWGLAVVGTFSSNPVSGMGNPLRLGVSDNWWHAGGFVLALLVVVLPARRVIVTDEPEQVEEPVAEPVAADHRDDHRADHREPVEPAMAHTSTEERDRDAAVAARTEHNDHERVEPMPEVATNEEAPARRKQWWNPSTWNKRSPDTTPGYR
jgi:uncharacterized protein DUF4383